MAVRCGTDRRRIGTMGLDCRVGPSAGTTIATSTERPSRCCGRAKWVPLRTRCASGLRGPTHRRRRVVVRRVMMASTANGARITEPGCRRSSVGSSLLLFELGRMPSSRSAWAGRPRTAPCNLHTVHRQKPGRCYLLEVVFQVSSRGLMPVGHNVHRVLPQGKIPAQVP
jgi:hypothetical protein